MVAAAPSLPRPLALRLDRMSRAAHRFHRFAHHPLCGEYQAEVLRFGRRVRICRGCSYVTAGTLGGFATAVILAEPPSLALVALGASISVLAAMRVAEGSAGIRAPRPSKLLTRFAPAFALGFGFASGLRTGGPLGAAVTLLAVLLAGGVALTHRRHGPDRAPCTTCSERTQPGACRGVAPIVQRERAFQRRASRIVQQMVH